jgi:hypothetical protein
MDNIHEYSFPPSQNIKEKNLFFLSQIIRGKNTYISFSRKVFAYYHAGVLKYCQHITTAVQEQKAYLFIQTRKATLPKILAPTSFI